MKINLVITLRKKSVKFRLLFLFLSPGVALASDSIFDNHIWYLGDNTLVTQSHAPVPMSGHTYDHSVNYTTPGGAHGSSDLCEVTSPTSLNCNSGDAISYNSQNYSAALTASFGQGTFTYYDKNHIPTASPISGDWHREQPNGYGCNNSDTIRIVIPYHDKNATTFEHIDQYYTTGFSRDATYYLVKSNRTGQLALSPVSGSVYFTSYYLYDKNNQPIYDLDKIDALAKLNDMTVFNAKCNMVKN